MKFVWSSFFVFLMTTCTHTKPSSTLSSVRSECDEKYNDLVSDQQNVEFVETSKTVAGTAASYTATGVGYVADAVVYVVEGTGRILIFCPQVVLASVVAVGSHANGSLYITPDACAGRIKPQTPSLGKLVYDSSKPLREKDLTSISIKTREVGVCYLGKKDRAGVERTLNQLKDFSKTPSFFDKVALSERALVMKDIESFEGWLKNGG